MKRHIRERFARKQSVFFIAPTIADIEGAAHNLEKGIEQYTFVLHSSLSEKEVVRRWYQALACPHPVLIIATAQFLSLPLPRLGIIILDQEHSMAYKTLSRPYLDQRTFARFYATAAHIDLLYADRLLSLETLEEFAQGKYLALSPLKFRPLTEANVQVIDMRPDKHSQTKNTFRLLSREVERAVRDTLASRTQMFLFAHRKGLAPTTVCQDCETIVSCRECTTPLALFVSTAGRTQSRDGTSGAQIFRCPLCHFEKPAEDQCVSCGSWRFALLGIGIEKVEETLRTKYPEAPLFILDAEHVKSHEAAKKLVRDFFATPGALLLGTEMSLYYLREPVARTAVVSLDALFAIPNFRMREKIMHLLLQMREGTTRDYLIQTRKPDDPLFPLLVRGDCMTWQRDELEERKQFHYPPYALFIKISTTESRPEDRERMQHLALLLKSYKPALYAPKSRHKGQERLHLLLRLDPQSWPDAQVVEQIKTLPPQYSVQVDPETLL